MHHIVHKISALEMKAVENAIAYYIHIGRSGMYVAAENR
jgi:hypothetical protein